MKRAREGHFWLGALVLLLAGAISGCATRSDSAGASAQPTIAAEFRPLQGTWEGAMVGDLERKITITISGDSLHFHRDTNFWFKTTFTLPAGKNPQELHATIRDCAEKESIGKVVVSIFKIEGEALTLLAMGDDAAEMPKSFDATAGARYELRKVASN